MAFPVGCCLGRRGGRSGSPPLLPPAAPPSLHDCCVVCRGAATQLHYCADLLCACHCRYLLSHCSAPLSQLRNCRFCCRAAVPLRYCRACCRPRRSAASLSCCRAAQRHSPHRAALLYAASSASGRLAAAPASLPLRFATVTPQRVLLSDVLEPSLFGLEHSKTCLQEDR